MRTTPADVSAAHCVRLPGVEAHVTVMEGCVWAAAFGGGVFVVSCCIAVLLTAGRTTAATSVHTQTQGFERMRACHEHGRCRRSELTGRRRQTAETTGRSVPRARGVRPGSSAIPEGLRRLVAEIRRRAARRVPRNALNPFVFGRFAPPQPAAASGTHSATSSASLYRPNAFH